MKLVRVFAVATMLMGAAVYCALAEDEDVVMVTLVENAAATFKEKGRDYALKLIGSMNSPFRRADKYVFAISMPDGVVLAEPMKKDLEGKSMLEFKDKNGFFYVKEFIDTANAAGIGWVEYYWLRPGEKQPTLKRTFVLKVPGENILVGGGVHEK